MSFPASALLHTSTPTIRIGLADGERIVARDEFLAALDLAATLADRVLEFLKTQNCELKALERIVVHAGPGGFTSLRVGVTMANALAYALSIPVVGVTGETFELKTLLAASKTTAPAQDGVVVPVYSKPPDIGPVPNT